MKQPTQDFMIAEHLQLYGARSTAYLSTRFAISHENMRSLLRKMVRHGLITTTDNERPQVWTFAKLPEPKVAKTRRPSSVSCTRQYQIWEWLVANGNNGSGAVCDALGISYDSTRNALQELKKKGHVTLTQRSKDNKKIVYAAVKTRPPAEFGLREQAQAERWESSKRESKGWAGLLRADLNVLATMPLVEVRT